MVKRILFLSFTITLIIINLSNIKGQTQHSKKILIVAGGKNFEAKQFYELFSSFDNIKYDTTSEPAVFDLFASDRIKDYDAVVFYITYQPISDVQKKAFENIFNLGIGCVFLHHSIVAHQDWPEYENILGGKYYHTAYTIEDGRHYGPSTYKHDQDFNVIILDKDNPVTKDMNDFPLHDEVYINYQVHNNVTPILTSDDCESGKYIGWTKTYNKSRIVVLIPGHDHTAYENPNIRKIIKNSIDWVSE